MGWRDWLEENVSRVFWTLAFIVYGVTFLLGIVTALAFYKDANAAGPLLGLTCVWYIIGTIAITVLMGLLMATTKRDK